MTVQAGSKNEKVIKSVIDRLVRKMETTGQVIWHPSHTNVSADAMINGNYRPRNFWTNQFYQGMNIVLLWGGSGFFITPKQLQSYNKKHKTNFWFKAGTPQDTVVRMISSRKRISEEYARNLINSGYGKYVQEIDGEFYQIYNSPCYASVIDCMYIFDENGKCIIPIKKVEQKPPFECKEEAETMILGYQNATGVSFRETKGTPHYSENGDFVALPPKARYRNQEVYYRDYFHELIHSTGITSRLNRPEFQQYSKRNQRSREELIAEAGSMILTVMAGFNGDGAEADNSANYVKGWCNWMKDNPQELFRGFIETQKAVEYFSEQSKRGLGATQEHVEVAATELSQDRIPETREELIIYLTNLSKENNQRGERTLARILKADKVPELKTSFKKAKTVEGLPVFEIPLPNKSIIDIGMSYATYTDATGRSKILFSLDRGHTLQQAQEIALRLKHKGFAQLVSYMDLRRKIPN